MSCLERHYLFGPYQGLNNLSVFLLPTDVDLSILLMNIQMWFTITLVGASMFIWIVKKVDVTDHLTFLALCLFYIVMTTEFMGGLHERHTMMADLLSIIFLFAWNKPQKWFIPLVLNAHSFLGYIRTCTGRWDAEFGNYFMLLFMIEGGIYFLFACWLMVFIYREFTCRHRVNLRTLN